ncbi:probable inactive leucine-rich repeat receptor-like protein kinase At3g03770 isoform X2 [Mangifera indica]|uniref:probable inactive leucine-rich repeat receptor-like protein kinase At3g03770 isoform X2 n=1 Tax=Mangifera indica TaxID=29780 RepID=UPI001CFAED48|nr:probable inactive leucine-rich repeat receptor-like protein kinase At3g03770 isoform X2 [Mangifera indica]
MAKPQLHNSYHFLLLLLICSCSVHLSKQLQQSQYETLMKIQELLDYPPVLNSFYNSSDLCNIEPTPSLTLVCYEDNLTQLHIVGDRGVHPLPQSFSSGSFFDTLGGLSSLKVLSLVSLRLWGAIPGSIGQLSSLEILNLSSNYFNGPIPVQLSYLKNLQTLILDNNNCSGKVPGWISSLRTLSVLSLKNNSLSGVLPSSLKELETLRVLSLSRNNLSGEVPDLHNLRFLQLLNLADNHFGPDFPNLHNKLITLVLRNNRFQFGLPGELSTYHQLQKLDISLNGFVGPFLPSILSLPSMVYLDIHGNKLTGMLFQNMSCNPELGYVDLSLNLLVGDLPSCLEVGNMNRLVLYSNNCLSNVEQMQHPSNFCHNEALAVKVLPHKENNKKPTAKSVISLSMVGAALGGIAVVGVVLLFVRKVYNKDSMKIPATCRLIMDNVSNVNTLKLLSDAKCISQTMKMGATLPVYRTFTLEELKEATDNFDVSSLIRESSHGQVYRGKLTDGTVVAIKSMKMRKRHSPQMYTRHIEMISKLRHRHLVSALGHCFENCMDDSSVTKIYLIFEFLPNRTLRSYISGQKLTWIQRIMAAIGVVKGVKFLHTGIVPGIFSNHLKITDVILDQDLHVKISTYNLPLLAENKGYSEVPYYGMKARPLARTQQDEKSDVYDIGVILLEIILGRPITSQNEVVFARDLLQVSITIDESARKGIVDPSVMNDCSEESLKTMMELCVRCLGNEPRNRPSVEDVLWNLQFAAQVQNVKNNQELV